MTHSLQRQCGIAAKSLMGQDCKGILSLFWPWRIIAGRYGGNDDGQYQLLPYPPDSAACNNLNVCVLFTKHCFEVETVRGNEFRLARHYMDDMVLQVTLGIRNIEASKMHHDESWWQRSPKNLEPVLRQAGGANLWGWGGPGANIQVALQQLAGNSPLFEDTTNKNVKLSNN